MSGWKVSSSTSGILIIVEKKRSRNRKQPFLKNSSKTVVNRTTFQETVRPDVMAECKSFTKRWKLALSLHLTLKKTLRDTYSIPTKKTESPKKEVFPKVNHLLSAELGLKPHPELLLLHYDSFCPPKYIYCLNWATDWHVYRKRFYFSKPMSFLRHVFQLRVNKQFWNYAADKHETRSQSNKVLWWG